MRAEQHSDGKCIGSVIDSMLKASEWSRESPGEKSHYAVETTLIGSARQLADPSVSKVDYSLFW